MNSQGSTVASTVVFEGVSKRFGASLYAIKRLDLEIRAGEFLTLLGPSGSGKTTALNLLAGFMAPTDGRILVDGADITRKPPHKRDIGVVFQNYALFPHMTVAENVGYPLKQRGVPKAERARKVEEALAMVSLEAFVERLPRELSGGQQQRVAVARSFVFGPKLLLMDEPLGALDRKLRESVQFELKRIHESLGVTVVFVTHDQEEALVMSDRVAVFDSGVIQQIGSPSKLYDKPRSQFVAEFLGDSNCWVGRIAGRAADTTTISGAQELSGMTVGTTPESGVAVLTVRPERCEIFAPNSAPDGWNSVPVRITDVVYLGATRKIVLALKDGGGATVVTHPSTEIPAAANVVLAFPTEAARVVPKRAPPGG